MALTAFYFVNSFEADLPWSTCQEEWDMCYDSSGGNASEAGNDTVRSSSELYF